MFIYYLISTTLKLRVSGRDNTDDALRCAFCEFVVSNWTDADDPWELHAAFVPMCIHVIFRKGLEFVQKILRKDGCGGEVCCLHIPVVDT